MSTCQRPTTGFANSTFGVWRVGVRRAVWALEGGLLTMGSVLERFAGRALESVSFRIHVGFSSTRLIVSHLVHSVYDTLSKKLTETPKSRPRAGTPRVPPRPSEMRRRARPARETKGCREGSREGGREQRKSTTRTKPRTTQAGNFQIQQQQQQQQNLKIQARQRLAATE